MDRRTTQEDSRQASMSITPIKNPYNEVVSAEFLELQSEIDTLLAQLQSLSRQRLSQTGSPQ